MSFSADSLRNKLEALDETQDSIVSTSQWILFYYRSSATIVDIWSQYLSKSTQKKKLALLYLCNDVVQQAKSKKRLEFINDFAKVLPIALTNTYNNVPEPIKQKIVKIVTIWKERRIFPEPIDIDGVTESISSVKSLSKPQSKQESFESLSNEEKLKFLQSSSKKFNTLYHQLLLAAHNKPDEKDSKLMEKLLDCIDDTVAQLSDLKDNIIRESDNLRERNELIKQKKLELEKKQKEIEEQKRIQEEKILNEILKKREQERLAQEKILQELKRQKEEDEMLPTYDSNESDSSDEGNNSTDDKKREETPIATSEESKEEERPTKKLRFAD